MHGKLVPVLVERELTGYIVPSLCHNIPLTRPYIFRHTLGVLIVLRNLFHGRDHEFLPVALHLRNDKRATLTIGWVMLFHHITSDDVIQGTIPEMPTGVIAHPLVLSLTGNH